MKNFFLILVMFILVGSVNAVQPARKPFLQIKIDGKSLKNGDVLTVKSGQKLEMKVDLEGGRRDFCKFPDTYSNLAGTAQILSRGDNGLSYELNGKKAEWKLVKENFRYTTDDFIKVNTLEDHSSAELIVTTANFSQSFIKISAVANWQFTEEGSTSSEENIAEGSVYFKVAGSSDVWFKSKNIQVEGLKNDLIQDKLNRVQANCDSVEQNFYKLNFSKVQQAIKVLQSTIDSLKTTIDEVKASYPTYKIKILFIGLPSDRPYADIDLLAQVKTNWASLEPLVNEIKSALGNLPEEPKKESKDELVNLITRYLDWQYKLPESTLELLRRYIPEFKAEHFEIPGNIHAVAEEKTVADYPSSFSEFNNFLKRRAEEAPNEVLKINSIHTRLQVIRLFDNNLRSIFASITWAEWESTRGNK